MDDIRSSPEGESVYHPYTPQRRGIIVSFPAPLLQKWLPPATGLAYFAAFLGLADSALPGSGWPIRLLENIILQ